LKKTLLSLTTLVFTLFASFTIAKNSTTILKIAADVTPHTELLEFIQSDIKKQNIELKIYTITDPTLVNAQTSDGELDANFFQHIIYMKTQTKDRHLDLVNAGNIHIEPMGIYSEKYKSISELPDNAKIAINNDSTNEYRVLIMLEKAGLIRLKSDIKPFTASINDIEKYLKPIQIVELDPSLITRLRKEFDAYSTWSNKILEANIDLQKTRIFSEEKNSTYVNIIATNSKRINDPAIKILVKTLRSDKVKKFIETKYKGSVVLAPNLY
jgi:D-methionine transport system substrate-binding protein